MAKVQDTIEIRITDEYGRSLDAFVRSIIRDELRRLATELSVTAMQSREAVKYEVEPFRTNTYERSYVMEEIAEAVQASAKKSELEV